MASPTDQPSGQPETSRVPGGRVADRVAGQVATVLSVRQAVSGIGAVLAAVGAVLLYRHSMRATLWGPFLEGDPPVEIVRYSTPWLVAAGGALLISGLLVTAFVADAVRRHRVRRLAKAAAPQMQGA